MNGFNFWGGEGSNFYGRGGDVCVLVLSRCFGGAGLGFRAHLVVSDYVCSYYLESTMLGMRLRIWGFIVELELELKLELLSKI